MLAGWCVATFHARYQLRSIVQLLRVHICATLHPTPGLPSFTYARQDENIGRDEYIGSCTFSLARAREAGSEHVEVPVMSKRSQKQHGLISVTLNWVPNVPGVIMASAPRPNYYARAPQPTYMAAPQPMYAPPSQPPMYMQAPQQAVYMAAPSPAVYFEADRPYGHHHRHHHGHHHHHHVELLVID